MGFLWTHRQGYWNGLVTCFTIKKTYVNLWTFKKKNDQWQIVLEENLLTLKDI